MIAEQVERPGGTGLRGVVDRVVGYRLEGYEPGTHVGLPSPTMTFIVSFDDPLTLTVLPDGRAERSEFWGVVSGLHDRPATIHHDGNQHGVQIDVSPLHARALFGMPAGALATQSVQLDQVLGRHSGELLDRLDAAGSWGTRFDVVDRVLGARIAELDRRHAAGPSVRWQLARAWSRLGEGGAAVAEVADELGWSRRHLRNQFRDEFGINPSTLVRLARFDRAQRWVRQHPDEPLAIAAAWCGYSDQSHMSRDWADLVGASPRAWLRNEQFPSVHDSDADAVAG